MSIFFERNTQRLMDAMAVCVRERGLRQTTVADVVREAKASRRTFYECYEDLTECYLDLMAHMHQLLLGAVETAMAEGGDMDERLDRAVGVYLDLFAADPEVSRSYWLEAGLTGDRGRELTLRSSREIGETISRLAAELREEEPRLHPVSPAMGTMIAAGIRDLALLTYDRGEPFDVVRETATDLLRRALGR